MTEQILQHQPRSTDQCKIPRICECGQVNAWTKLSHQCHVAIHSRHSTHQQRSEAVNRLTELRIQRREHICQPYVGLDLHHDSGASLWRECLMGHIYRRGRLYWLKYYRDGRAFYESSGSTKETEAKRLLKLSEGDISRGLPVTSRMHQIKFSELAEGVLTDYAVNGRRSLKHVESRYRLHLLPYFGHRKVSTISTDLIRRYISRRQKEAENATGFDNRKVYRGDRVKVTHPD